MSDALERALAPVLDALADLDLSDRQAAEQALDLRVSLPAREALTRTLLDAHAAGTLTPRRATPTLTFGRVAKASDTTRGFAVDAVDIAGTGAPHMHPRGEVSWCVPLEGSPRFEGAAEGWVVLPPKSRHAPTVTGGRMLIVYFLPGGEVAWDAA